MAQHGEIKSHLAAWLAVNRFKDYGPNGLPAEGRTGVQGLGAGCAGPQAWRQVAAGEQLAARFRLARRGFGIEFDLDDPASPGRPSRHST